MPHIIIERQQKLPSVRVESIIFLRANEYTIGSTGELLVKDQIEQNKIPDNIDKCWVTIRSSCCMHEGEDKLPWQWITTGPWKLFKSSESLYKLEKYE